MHTIIGRDKKSIVGLQHIFKNPTVIARFDNRDSVELERFRWMLDSANRPYIHHVADPKTWIAGRLEDDFRFGDLSAQKGPDRTGTSMAVADNGAADTWQIGLYCRYNWPEVVPVSSCPSDLDQEVQESLLHFAWIVR